MKNKLVVLLPLLSGISIVAMERIKEMAPALKDASHGESRVKICLADAQNHKTTHEVEIPVRLANLIGAFNEFVEDSHFDPVWSLPNVAITIWRLIEPQLERVYRITHDASQSAHLRQEIMTEFRKLDVKSLIGVVCASDYLEIPLLLESACEVVKQSALDKISWEELEELPFHIRNQIVMNKLIMLLGPVSGRALAVCGGHKNAVRAICVTKDGKIVSGSDDKTVRVCDMDGNQDVVCRGHEGWVDSVCVTKDGKIVSGSGDRTVRIWDMQGNQLALFRGHERAVNSVCVTNDGKVVSGSGDRTVRIWDMQGNQLALFRGHERAVNSVCVTQDGKIVSGSSDGLVRVWDMEGNQLAVCRGHEGDVKSVCVTEDGKIVLGSDDKTVRVWDMEGNQLGVCRGHQGWVTSVCVTQDGKIVSGSGDNTVRVWDMQGNELAVCRGHEDSVQSVCVTIDGKIVSGSYDRTVRVWDVQGNQLAVCRGGGSVFSVCVTKDGKIVSGCSSGRTVGVWDIGLLGRIMCMNEDHARAVWGLLQSISTQAEIDKQKLWLGIKNILGEEAPAPSNINNNNE